MTGLNKKGVTLMELMVVLVIISILSTIAVGIYSKEVVRAKFAKTRQEIRTLEIAITQYEIDTGELPPSGSGRLVGGLLDYDFQNTLLAGSGLLQLALRHSMSGDMNAPASARWMGPYIDWDYNRMGGIDGTPITNGSGGGPDGGPPLNIGQISFLDPWGTPYTYIRHQEYLIGGTELPADNPFAATEVWYNPSTFQIRSKGLNGTTSDAPNEGTDADDVTNFISPSN